MGGNLLRKPKNRIERVEFLIKKQGHDLTVNLVASMTDSELKKYFNRIYPIYKNQDDYVKPQFELPTCLIWGNQLSR